MEYIPWKTFGRIIDRHGGGASVRTLGCADVFREIAFSQLMWRESLRDIESCLASHQSKLFHMGLSGVLAKPTLSDALNQRDWRIYHELAMRLIVRARNLYAKESTGLGVCTELDYHRPVFEPVRLGAVSKYQSGGKNAHVAGFAWCGTGFYSHQRWQDGRCQSTRHLAHRGGSILRDGSGLSGFRKALQAASSESVFCDLSQARNERTAGVLEQDRSKCGSDLRPVYSAQRFLRVQGISRAFASYPIQRPGNWQNAGVSDQQYHLGRVDHRGFVLEMLASRIVL